MEDWRRLYLSYVQYECTSYSQKAAGKRARRVTEGREEEEEGIHQSPAKRPVDD
jgi:hypothetical protein